MGGVGEQAPEDGQHQDHRHSQVHILPAWLRRTPGEPRWPAVLAVLAIIGLQLALPRGFAPEPEWLLPATEVVLLLILVIADPGRVNRETRVLRMLGLAVVLAASLATTWSVYRLVLKIINNEVHGAPLLVNGALIWLTNLIVFALWYWELDRGGPAARANATRIFPDFLFPQMSEPKLARPDWEPQFVDYLYLAFTNSTAFSPTDTMPMSRTAKLAMMFQSAVSFGVVILVIARAVNVLVQ